MPTDQVTQLHPLLHNPPCERETYGRAAMALLDLDVEITAARVRGWVSRFRETATCDCRELRVKNLEGQLERARKAAATGGDADRVVSLRAQLAALRGGA